MKEGFVLPHSKHSMLNYFSCHSLDSGSYSILLLYV